MTATHVKADAIKSETIQAALSKANGIKSKGIQAKVMKGTL